MRWMVVILMLILSGCMGMSAIDSGSSWQEEVLLHDGRKIVAERSVKFGGRHEVGQRPGYTEQTLTFKLPGRSQTIRWKDSASADLENSNFLPMLLDVVKDTPYLVTYPMGCLSYNKWGRPNPPYVIFKYESHAWQRIALDDLPIEIKTPNLIFSDPAAEVDGIGHNFISASMIQKIIAKAKQIEYRNIVRKPLEKERIVEMCGDRIFYNGYWILPNDLVAKSIIDNR